MKNIKDVLTAGMDNLVRFEGAEQLVIAMRTNVKVWSWGAHGWKLFEGKVLRFMVSGHHHKGHVYVTVNVMDTFDIYLTTSQGNIKGVLNGIYLDQLIEVIDNRVERIVDYKL